jgi:hypothetical protein
VQPHDDRIDVTGDRRSGVDDDVGAGPLERLDDTGPAATSTRSRGCTSAVTAVAELTTSPPADIPTAASASSCSASVAAELLVTNNTRRPDRRSAATASTDPAIG